MTYLALSAARRLIPGWNARNAATTCSQRFTRNERMVIAWLSDIAGASVVVRKMSMTTPPKPPRGRPKVPADKRKDRIVRARVTAEAEAEWNRRGGAVWLRRSLKRAKKVT